MDRLSNNSFTMQLFYFVVSFQIWKIKQIFKIFLILHCTCMKKFLEEVSVKKLHLSSFIYFIHFSVYYMKIYYFSIFIQFLLIIYFLGLQIFQFLQFSNINKNN